MSEEVLVDDQSHYEISLTAGQAFVAFVLLLLSLAASFAFGLMIGRGQSEDRLVVKKEPAVITEASALGKARNDGKIVELGVDDFKEQGRAGVPPAGPAAVPAAAAKDTTSTTVTTTAEIVPATVTETTTTTPPPSARRDAAQPAGETPARPAAPAAPGKPVYAQLLSTVDQKTAEALAAKLIDGGFTSAYVERAGTAFKVRVRFPTEAEARAAEPKLREFAKDVWIVK